MFVYPKMIFQKKINLIFCLFLLSLATQSLKINFSSFFHPGQGSPLHWGLVHYFSISIIIRFTGGYFAIYLICLPHWGLTQLEYCSSKWLGIPLHQGYPHNFCISKIFSCNNKKKMKKKKKTKKRKKKKRKKKKEKKKKKRK